MRKLQDQQGYTLVLVLGIFVIFTILGMSMLTLTMNGAQKSENRESYTQAQDLSVKGIDHFLAKINNDMVNEVVSIEGITYQPLKNGQDSNVYLQKFEAVLGALSCTKNQPSINGVTGTSNYCIEEAVDKSPSNPFKKIITVRSIGKANTKEFETIAKYEIGVASNDTIGNYAITTFGYDPNNPNSKGNIEIHGGVLVDGDIHADNKLIVSDTSRYKGTMVESILPIFVNKQSSTGKPRIEVGSTMHKKTSALDGVAAGAPVTKADIGLSDYDVVAGPRLSLDYNLNQKFVGKVITTSTPHTVKKSKATLTVIPDFPLARVSERRLDTVVSGLVTTHTHNFLMAETTNINLKDDTRVIMRGPTHDKNDDANALIQWPEVTGGLVLTLYNRNPFSIDWDLSKKNEFKSVGFPKDLYLRHGVELKLGGDPFNWSTHPQMLVKDYAYIAGNMMVGLDTETEVNFGLFKTYLDTDALGLLSGLESLANIETPVHLEGDYYIEGDLIISSARLYGDANFYVKGNVIVLFSEIGVGTRYTEESNFNIYAGGEVKMSYIGNNHNSYNSAMRGNLQSYFQDDVNRSEFNGHIHSNKKITIDGATSYLTINGSLSAPEVFITSIKGRSEASCRNIGSELAKKLLFPILSPVLKFLDTITFGVLVNPLLNLLVGDHEDDGDMAYVRATKLPTDIVALDSNCFQKASIQAKNSHPYSTYLLKVLNLNLLHINKEEYPIESRVKIIYKDEEKVPFIQEKKFYDMAQPILINRQ